MNTIKDTSDYSDKKSEEKKFKISFAELAARVATAPKVEEKKEVEEDDDEEDKEEDFDMDEEDEEDEQAFLEYEEMIEREKNFNELNDGSWVNYNNWVETFDYETEEMVLSPPPKPRQKLPNALRYSPSVSSMRERSPSLSSLASDVQTSPVNIHADFEAIERHKKFMDDSHKKRMEELKNLEDIISSIRKEFEGEEEEDTEEEDEELAEKRRKNERLMKKMLKVVNDPKYKIKDSGSFLSVKEQYSIIQNRIKGNEDTGVSKKQKQRKREASSQSYPPSNVVSLQKPKAPMFCEQPRAEGFDGDDEVIYLAPVPLNSSVSFYHMDEDNVKVPHIKKTPEMKKPQTNLSEFTSFNEIFNNDEPVERKRTMICNSIIKQQKCTHENCKFAHSRIEFEPMECKFGQQCKKVNCNFKHNESVDEYCDRLGLFPVRKTPPTPLMSPPSSVPRPNKSKMLCVSVKKGIPCANGASCKFAHNQKELVLCRQCVNKETCRFMHPDEKFDAFISRIKK